MSRSFVAPLLAAFFVSGAALAAEPATSTVHVASPKPVILERRETPESGWMVMCDSPCDKALPLEGEYRFSGPGMTASETFRLNAAPGSRIVLSVTPKSTFQRNAGTVVFIAGLVFDVLAGASTAATIVWHAQGQHPEAEDSLRAALIYGAIGATLTTAGVLLMNGSYTKHESAAPTPPVGAAPREAAAAPRRDAIDPHVRSLVVPVLSGTF